MRNVIEEAWLYCRAGSRNAVYYLALVEREDGFHVEYGNCRYGKSLKFGEKTKGPVTAEKAKKQYDATYKEKTTDTPPYIPGEPYGDYVPAEQDAEEALGNIQLLNPIDIGDTERYIRDDQYLIQEKEDGERRQIGRKGGTFYARNKRGKTCGFPRIFEEELARALPEGDFLLDGEEVGMTYRVFDVLEAAGRDLRDFSCQLRIEARDQLLGAAASDTIRLVPTAITEEEKRALVGDITARAASGAEGWVIKRKEAPYKAGRPANGGAWLKAKITESATVRVSRVNAQRSVGFEVMDDKGIWTEIGNVTVPVNREVPAIGDFLEVRYRHANPGGALQQTVFLGPRTDVIEEDCRMSQLRFKHA